MANDCEYTARVFGRNRETVEQFVAAMKYRDLENGYYMCRIFEAECGEDCIWRTDDGIWVAEVTGYCAWSVGGCMIDTGYGDWRGMDYGEPKFHVWRDDDGGIRYSNIGVTASMLCRALGVAFEVFSEEPGCEFQEHYAVSPNGDIFISECAHWEEGTDYYDESGKLLTEAEAAKDYAYCERNEDKDIGGIPDWGMFMSPSSALNGEEE